MHKNRWSDHAWWCWQEWLGAERLWQLLQLGVAIGAAGSAQAGSWRVKDLLSLHLDPVFLLTVETQGDQAILELEPRVGEPQLLSQKRGSGGGQQRWVSQPGSGRGSV